MSLHAYCRNWLHVIWATKNRYSYLSTPESRIEVSRHLHDYACSKNIYLKINHVYIDHVHLLIDLPEDLCLREAVKWFKGESSHWINQNRVIPYEFHWQRGYGAFSVSQSGIEKVCKYIADQVEHHRKRTFEEEIRGFVRLYGLAWKDEGGYEKVDDGLGQFEE